MLRHSKTVFLFLFAITISAVLVVTVLTRKFHQDSTVPSTIAKKRDRKNYTVTSCLKRFNTEKEFLDLIETGPNITAGTKILATSGGGLFTGKGYKKTKDDKIVEAYNADTDPHAATVAEIKAALREKENTVILDKNGNKINPLSPDEVNKTANLGENENAER